MPLNKAIPADAGKPSDAEILQRRLQLLDRGYKPIPLRKKAVVMKGWPSYEASRADIRSEYALLTRPRKRELGDKAAELQKISKHWRDDRNTGVITGKLCVLDLDCLNEEYVDGILDACEKDGLPVSEFERIGQLPKVALFYRRDENDIIPAKLVSNKYCEPGQDPEAPDVIPHALEVLSSGSQIAVHGLHPKTQKPYHWVDKTIFDHGIEDLPVLSRKDAERAIQIAEQYFESRGCKLIQQGISGDIERKPVLHDEMPLTVAPMGCATIGELKAFLKRSNSGEVRFAPTDFAPGAQNPTRANARLWNDKLQIFDFGTGILYCETESDAHAMVDQLRQDNRYMSLLEHQQAADDKAEEAKKSKETAALRKTVAPLATDPTLPIKKSIGKKAAVAALLYRFAYDITGDSVVALHLRDENGEFEVTPRRNFEQSFRYLSTVQLNKKGGETKIIHYWVDAWARCEARITFNGVRYDPGGETPFFKDGGFQRLNQYASPNHLEPTGQDKERASVIYEFLQHLVPDEHERNCILQCLAYKARNLKWRGFGIVMIADNLHGSGRSEGFTGLLRKLFGLQNIEPITMDTLMGVGAAKTYNAWEIGNLFAVVDETKAENEGRKYGARTKAAAALREHISPGNGRRVRVNPKYGAQYMGVSYTSVVVYSNYVDAIQIGPEDRRMLVVANGGKLIEAPENLRDRYFAALEDPAVSSAFYNELRYAISLDGFDAYGDAPATETKQLVLTTLADPFADAAKEFFEKCAGAVVIRHQFDAHMREAMRAEGGSYMADDKQGQALTRQYNAHVERVKSLGPLTTNSVKLAKGGDAHRFSVVKGRKLKLLKELPEDAKAAREFIKLQIRKNGHVEAIDAGPEFYAITQAAKEHQDE